MTIDAVALRRLLDGVRVSGMDATLVRVPFRRPFLTASGMWLQREAWIVRVRGEGGRVGIGEAALESGAREVAVTVLGRLVRDAASRAVDGDLPSSDELGLHGSPGRALAAALDAARLDLLGGTGPAREVGKGGRSGSGGTLGSGEGAGPGAAPGPSDLLAAAPPAVRVNGTITFGGADAGAEAARQAVEAGFTTLKLKAGAERETADLVARVRAVRGAVGPKVRLRLDVNGAWDLPTAEERLEAVARYDLEYVEQPLPADDVDGLASLRRTVEVRIAADEAVESPAAARALIAARAADVLVVKPARVGGPVAVAEIAALAAASGMPVVVSTLFETGVGVAAALAAARLLPPVERGPFAGLPPAHGLATAGLLEHDLLRAPLQLDDGWLSAPGGDGGLGVTLDPRATERFAADEAEAVS